MFFCKYKVLCRSGSLKHLHIGLLSFCLWDLQAPNPFSWDGFMAARSKHTQPEIGKANRPELAKSSRHPEASVGGRDFASQPDALKSRPEVGSGMRPQQAKSRPKPTKATAAPEAPTKVCCFALVMLGRLSSCFR